MAYMFEYIFCNILKLWMYFLLFRYCGGVTNLLNIDFYYYYLDVLFNIFVEIVL
jgi:hypothetical protein